MAPEVWIPLLLSSLAFLLFFWTLQKILRRSPQNCRTWLFAQLASEAFEVAPPWIRDPRAQAQVRQSLLALAPHLEGEMLERLRRIFLHWGFQDELLKKLSSPQRAQAAFHLGSLKVEEAISALVPLLQDRDFSVRTQAALALAKIDQEESVTPLLQILPELLRHPDPQVLEIVYFLGERAQPTLLRSLRDPDAELRIRAVYLLGRIAKREDAPHLYPLLQDSHPRVRAHTCAALGLMSYPPAKEKIKGLRNDPDPRVQSKAQEAFLRLTPLENPVQAT
ncbi:MAG: HEAT repeat domain-containing protein [Elusimicrobia bacterium]|nr:HEAT repeat domain-containing protein [Elusimicrobiota bacterium]